MKMKKKIYETTEDWLKENIVKKCPDVYAAESELEKATRFWRGTEEDIENEELWAKIKAREKLNDRIKRLLKTKANYKFYTETLSNIRNVSEITLTKLSYLIKELDIPGTDEIKEEFKYRKFIRSGGTHEGYIKLKKLNEYQATRRKENPIKKKTVKLKKTSKSKKPSNAPHKVTISIWDKDDTYVYLKATNTTTKNDLVKITCVRKGLTKLDLLVTDIELLNIDNVYVTESNKQSSLLYSLIMLSYLNNYTSQYNLVEFNKISFNKDTVVMDKNEVVIEDIYHVFNAINSPKLVMSYYFNNIESLIGTLSTPMINRDGIVYLNKSFSSFITNNMFISSKHIWSEYVKLDTSKLSYIEAANIQIEKNILINYNYDKSMKAISDTNFHKGMVTGKINGMMKKFNCEIDVKIAELKKLFSNDYELDKNLNEAINILQEQKFIRILR